MRLWFVVNGVTNNPYFGHKIDIPFKLKHLRPIKLETKQHNQTEQLLAKTA